MNTKVAGYIISILLTLFITYNFWTMMPLVIIGVGIYITYLIIRLLKAKIKESEEKGRE